MRSTHHGNIFLGILALCSVTALFSSEINATSSKHKSDTAAELTEIPPGSWMRVGTNTHAAVAYTRAEHDALMQKSGSPPFWGVVGPKSAIIAWQGAAFDPDSGRMFFHGGGHSDYGGNEVYQFDFKTKLWSRLNNPSPYTGSPIPNGKGVDARYPAAGPIAVHTYDGLVWSPATKSIWLAAKHIGFDVAGLSTPPARYFWEFDPRSLQWTPHPGHSGYRSPSTVFAGDSGEVWAFGNSPTATIVGPDGHVDDVILTGAYNHLTLGSAAYDPVSRSAIYARTSYGKNLLRIRRTAKGLSAERLTEIPLPAMEILGGGAGVAVRKGIVWLWGGNESLVSWDPKTEEWRIVAPNSGPSGSRVYGKFYYWPQQDVFVGASGLDGPWVYRPREKDGTEIAENKVRARIDGVDYTSLQEAFRAARDGDTVTIEPGIYAEGVVVNASHLKIVAKGVHIKGAAVGGKATFVVRGDDTTIIGLEVSGVNVPDGNGAAIRMEGRTITLKNVYFHDSQQGLLGGGGTVTVENSRFERLGGDARSAPGQAHGIYVNYDTEALIIRNSKFLASKEEGHEIKSRAARTEIYDSVIDSRDGIDSRLIDVPNAGVLIVERTILREGPNSANDELIGYGLEPQNGGLHGEQRITIRGSRITNASGTVRKFLRIGNQAKPTVTIAGSEFVEIEPNL